MSRKQPKLIPLPERTELLDEFWTMIALLETREEVKNFFKDLLSETEALMLARRIQIAKMLLKGRSYEDVAGALKASTGTIANVHRWLQGGFGGYVKALPKLQKELERRQQIRERNPDLLEPYSFEWIRRRYPRHFLLFNLLLDSSSPQPPRKLRKKK